MTTHITKVPKKDDSNVKTEEPEKAIIFSNPITPPHPIFEDVVVTFLWATSVVILLIPAVTLDHSLKVLALPLEISLTMTVIAYGGFQLAYELLYPRSKKLERWLLRIIAFSMLLIISLFAVHALGVVIQMWVPAEPVVGVADYGMRYYGLGYEDAVAFAKDMPAAEIPRYEMKRLRDALRSLRQEYLWQELGY